MLEVLFLVLIGFLGSRTKQGRSREGVQTR